MSDANVPFLLLVSNLSGSPLSSAAPPPSNAAARDDDAAGSTKNESRCISFLVSVPVLSEKIKSIWPMACEMRAFWTTGASLFSASYILRSFWIRAAWRKLTVSMVV